MKQNHEEESEALRIYTMNAHEACRSDIYADISTVRSCMVISGSNLTIAVACVGLTAVTRHPSHCSIGTLLLMKRKTATETNGIASCAE